MWLDFLYPVLQFLTYLFSKLFAAYYGPFNFDPLAFKFWKLYRKKKVLVFTGLFSIYNIL